MPPVFSKELNGRYIQADGLYSQPRTSPCEARCPAGNPIQLVHALIRDGRTEEALAQLRTRNPFPGVTGRACPHPCEGGCNRATYDQAVSIRALERHAADRAVQSLLLRPLPSAPSGKTVAVVGSGPAGMTAAYFAALLGHAVTVFERAPVLGGIPRQAAPDFRLPKDVVDIEIGRVLELGVTAHTNVAVGRDVSLASLLAGYDACLLATGLWRERILDIPGIEAARTAVAWLTAANLRRERLDGQKVVILGGGGVALDCAFTARRLGASEVHLVCLEAAGAMRAPVEEIEQARAEGIRIHNSCLNTAVCCEGGRATGVAAAPIASFSFDARGELSVDKLPGEPLLLAADLVICASGLSADLGFLAGLTPPALTPRGLLAADPLTMQTSLPGLFAAGDIAGGPSTIATAIGNGRRAAVAIHRFLAGLPADQALDIALDAEGRVAVRAVEPAPAAHVVEYKELMHVDYHEQAPRRQTRTRTPAPMDPPFAEIDLGLSPEDARAEAARCLHCGHCMACGECVESCPGHILSLTGDGPVVSYPDQCWHCGCCRIACPCGAVSYKFPLNMLI
jgi:NADPH-dependent glutamate synthase beta subunit-like oxidoreductase